MQTNPAREARRENGPLLNKTQRKYKQSGARSAPGNFLDLLLIKYKGNTTKSGARSAPGRTCDSGIQRKSFFARIPDLNAKRF